MEQLIKSSREDSRAYDSIDQDLLLAAEIGKTLLEKNRELELVLKSVQDFADEQTAQVEFYLKQVEILRESNDSSHHSYEVLESSNQTLHDKYNQLNTEYKILEGKNSRLWELINSLEKKNEDLTTENCSLKDEIAQDETACLKSSKQPRDKVHEQKPIVISNDHVLANHENETMTRNEESEQLTKELHELNAVITNLKVQVKVEKWQREELHSQLQDEINNNQILHQKIAQLNKEILEWESFAQKEECYRRIAEAFTIKHNIEVEETFLQNINQHPHWSHSLSPGSLSKAKSCEFLNCPPINSTSHKQQNIIKSSKIRNSLLASGNSNSILSELDKEYHDLVKRYEALLDKCKQEGKLIDNPERTRKVQRAIQTLSLDFSQLTTPIQSPTKLTKSPSHEKQRSMNAGLVANDESAPSPPLPSSGDYKALFSQIFQKLKESKEFSNS